MAIEPFIGEIMMFAGNFEPRGWAFCNGQLMPIAQNTALFSILGTTYGGDGITTFALPNPMGRAPMHWGSGVGLTQRDLGEKGGQESVVLTQGQLPAHAHAIKTGTTSEGAGTGVSGGAASETPVGAGTTDATGQNLPVPTQSPFTCVSFCIALWGVYPSRN